MNVKLQEKCLIFMNELIAALKKGKVIISFTKIDTGKLRVMPSTLNDDLIPEDSKILNISPDSDTIMVWSLDKNAWRDIRANTITEWRVDNE